MATQAATFTQANTHSLRAAMQEFLNRIAIEGNPDNLTATVTITTDTAGTITFALAAHQGNAAFSKAVTATVA
jgi:hypothetical protein